MDVAKGFSMLVCTGFCSLYSPLFFSYLVRSEVRHPLFTFGLLFLSLALLIFHKHCVHLIEFVLPTLKGVLSLAQVAASSRTVMVGRMFKTPEAPPKWCSFT